MGIGDFMVWTAVSGTVPQYQKLDGTLASNYYIKAYAAGTTTAISIATDNTGATTLAKVQLDSGGYPINGSGAAFIPYVDQDYKLVLYQNSTDADANTTANADWVIDNNKQFQQGVTDIWNLFGSAPTQTSATTFTLAGDQTASFVVGDRLKFTDATTLYGTITASSYSAPNTTVTVKLDSGSLTGSLTGVYVSQSDSATKPISASTIAYYPQNVANAVLSTVYKRLFEIISLSDFGVLFDGSTNNLAAFQSALDYAETSGAALFATRGVCIINGAVTYNSTRRLVMLGVSRDANSGTIVRFTGSESAGLTITCTQASQGCLLSQISFQEGGTNTSGVKISSLRFPQIINCGFRSFQTSGLQLSDTGAAETHVLSALILYNEFVGNGVDGLRVDAFVNGQFNNNTIMFNSFYGAQNGIRCSNTKNVNNRICKNVFEAHTSTEIIFTQGSALDISNNYFEWSTAHNNIITLTQASSSVTINRNNFQGVCSVDYFDCTGSVTGLETKNNHVESGGAAVNWVKILSGTKLDVSRPTYTQASDPISTTINFVAGGFTVSDTRVIRAATEEHQGDLTVKGSFLNGALNTADTFQLTQNSTHAVLRALTGRMDFENLNGNFLRWNTANEFVPGTDASFDLGSAVTRWRVVYASTGTINTSDDREKTYLEINDFERNCAVELKSQLKKFKWNSAIDKKGFGGARIHFGASAQTIRAIFNKYGLNAKDYGLFCYDEWEAEPEELDEDGNVLTPAREAGNRYGVRYDELICFILSAL